MSAVQRARDLLNTPGPVVGLTVEQYHRMIEGGILESGAPIELLDGFLVHKDRAKAGEDPMTVGNEHLWAVENLRRVFRGIEAHGFDLMCQQPVTLPPDGEPEPDGAVVRGTIDDYRRRKPTAGDVACVIEVADSSLDRDRGTKQRIYADAGIAQYVIINLAERVIEVYERPVAGSGRYADVRRLRGAELVAFQAGGAQVEVEAERLLP
jgi:Uma2 family endonuclease